MALQTNVLQDGQWVTQTVDVRSVIEANDNVVKKPTFQPSSRPVTCGILSRTVLESPVTHWVLSARLRSLQQNDIAFIGVSWLTCFPDPTLRVPLCCLGSCYGVRLTISILTEAAGLPCRDSRTAQRRSISRRHKKERLSISYHKRQAARIRGQFVAGKEPAKQSDRQV
jgi:hypothetical protein